jgi:hypothetical protein
VLAVLKMRQYLSVQRKSSECSSGADSLVMKYTVFRRITTTVENPDAKTTSRKKASNVLPRRCQERESYSMLNTRSVVRALRPLRWKVPGSLSEVGRAGARAHKLARGELEEMANKKKTGRLHRGTEG